MTLYAVDHIAFPLPVLVDAYDGYAAARKAKSALGSETEDGESLTVTELVCLPSDRDAPECVGYGEEEVFSFDTSVNNFRKGE